MSQLLKYYQVLHNRYTLNEKMVLFHIAAVGWISPQTGYEIQGSISTQN